MTNINWFPGHMAKAVRNLQNTPKLDLILEVVDARAIHTSQNNELTKLLNKDKLTIALKSDLADLKNVVVDQNTIVGTIKSKELRNQIIYALNQKFAKKIQTLKSKGLINPQFYIMVVGLPNVGKSSLINYLAHKNNLIVENRPGVTKNKQLVKINDTYYLYDTPGIFIKNIANRVDGIKLALLGVVKKEILPTNEIVEWALNYLSENYPALLTKKYDISFTNFSDFVNSVSCKYHFVKNNAQNDITRTINFLFDELVNGKGLKVNYEK